MNRGRDQREYWDIVKGIGIIAIVLGHSGSAATAFVYLWHVPLFFFITGYLYHEVKYAADPFGYLGKRIKSTWPKFMLYALVAVLTHNLLVRGGVYPPGEMYSLSRHVTALLLAFPYGISETVMGPMWFVPSWVLSAFLFGLCVWAGTSAVSAAASANASSCSMDSATGTGDPGTICKYPVADAVTAASAAGMGMLGIWLVTAGHTLQYNLQTSFLCVPLFWAAWILRRGTEGSRRCGHREGILKDMPERTPGGPAGSVTNDVSGNALRRILPWCGTVLLLLLLLAVNVRGHIFFDLKANQVPGLLFYPITLAGIGWSLCLAAGIRQIPGLRLLLRMFGRYSFDIMGLHILIFKLADILWVRHMAAGAETGAGTLSEELAQGLAAFPCGFVQPLGPVYRLAGLFLPLLICLAAGRIKRVLHRFT